MIHLRVLGGLDLRDASDGRRLRSVLAQPKRAALLAFLALEGTEDPVPRSRLLGLFWMRSTEERARNALNQALHVLRRSLGDGVVVSEPDGGLTVDRARISCDALAFEEALDTGRPAEALELYGGDLLEGVEVGDSPGFERWLDLERGRLRERALRAAAQLADARLAAGNATDAVHWARQAVRWAPFDEAAVRRLLVLLDHLGDRAGALRAYGSLEARLRREFGAEPAPATRELAAGIRAREDSRPPAESAPGAGTPPGAGAPSSSPGPETKDVAAASREEPAPRSESPIRRGLRTPLAAAAVLVAILLLGIAAVALTGPGRDGAADAGGDTGAPATPLAANRVLVAPLLNLTGDTAFDLLGPASADWIARGLHETGMVEVVLLTGLGGEPPPYESSGRDGSTVELIETARRRGARLIVSGSIRERKGRLVLEASVVDATSGTVVRTIEPAAAPASDPLEAVDRLRERASGAVAAIRDPRIGSWAAVASQPPSLAAYRSYVDGLALYRELEFDAAVDRLLAASAADSSFTAPLFYAMQIRRDDAPWVDSVARELLPRRDRLAAWDRAMLDYNLAEVRGDREGAYRAAAEVAELAPGSRWLHLAAGEALRVNRPSAALAYLDQLDPDRPDPVAPDAYWRLRTEALHRLGRYEDELAAVESWRQVRRSAGWRARCRALAGLGRPDSVLREVELLAETRQWTPGLSHALRSVAVELEGHGHGAAAAAVLDRALSLHERSTERREGDGYHPAIEHGRTLAAADRAAEARSIFRRLLERGEMEAVVRGDLGVLAARLGDVEEAERHAAWFEAGAERNRPFDGGWHRQWQARIVAHMGRPGQAVRLLRTAFAEGWSHQGGYHMAEGFEPLRGYPPFEELVRPLAAEGAASTRLSTAAATTSVRPARER